VSLLQSPGELTVGVVLGLWVLAHVLQWFS
jgi:hypothetical protein